MDVNWDQTILHSCVAAGLEEPGSNVAANGGTSTACLQESRDEIVEIVYQRMFKSFVKELFKVSSSSNTGETAINDEQFLSLKEAKRSRKKKNRKVRLQ